MKDELLLRYSRQILLPQIGIEGQQKLLDAHVLIIGLGGLGSPVAYYLAAAGVGELTLVDHDKVDLTNLQRQIIHHSDRIGTNKAFSAKHTLQDLNPEPTIHCIDHRLHGDALASAIEQADIVVDATDNFTSRFEINRMCHRHHTPLVSGAAIRLEGQLSVYDYRDKNSPCYRCLYQDIGEEQETCSETGILGPVVGTIGSLQALEVIKLITGVGESLTGYLLIFDAFNQDWRKMKLRKDPACPVCGDENNKRIKS